MSASIDLLSITTPLPDTSFDVAGVSGAERLSRPYGYTAHLHSGTAVLDANSLLDQAVTVTIGNPEVDGRYISGIVRAVRQMPSESTNLWDYQISVVPKLWFLGQTRDCRYFQQMTVPDIVTGILGKFSVTYSSKLTGTYVARDYVVMFNESYLHFIQRLLEDEGIFYFFTHTNGAHTMVLADANTAFAAIALPNVELDEHDAGFGRMSTWVQEDHTAIGMVRTDDYNPATDQPVPGAITGTETTVLKASAASQRTHYTWPAVRDTTSPASTKARLRMAAAEAAAQIFSGSGQILDFVAGGKFTLKDDPTTGADTEYVIQSVSYNVADTVRGSSTGGRSTVSMSVTAFPSATEWHEEPSVAPPAMAGIYTAQVIGASGEEIYTDSLGRIQVKFPSDNAGDITTDKTLWVRVMQSWAGNAWGTQFIPRVGMEVAVAFLEGDVNRPVVIGSLVNTNNPPVFAVADKNKSGWRTRSTKSGSATTFHELSWDDTKGSELFYLHAEKDYSLETENDQTLSIGHNRTVEVKNNETETVDNDRSHTVKNNDTLQVNNNRSATVNADESVTVKGKKTDAITGNYTIGVSSGNLATTVDSGNVSLQASAGTITESAAQSITLKVGGNSIVINMQGITMTVGGNSIQIAEQGITISGMQVQVNGQVQVQVAGPMVQVQADAMLELTGGITMINS